MEAPNIIQTGDSTTSPFEWHPRRDLFAPDTQPQAKFGIIVLNQPIDPAYRHAALKLWFSAEYHIAADGGANSIYDFERENGGQQISKLVNFVIGDLDSIRPEVEAHFSDKHACPHAKIIRDPSVDATDFGKAVHLARTDADLSKAAKDLVVFAGLGGRIDQAFSIFHYLHVFQSNPQYKDGRMYLYTGEGLAFLLKPGTHRIFVREPDMADRFEKHVGIIPIGEPSVITTKGLEWDVTEWPTSFGSQVSTSNHILPETQVVEIKTTKDVVFTMAIKKIDGNHDPVTTY